MTFPGWCRCIYQTFCQCSWPCDPQSTVETGTLRLQTRSSNDSVTVLD